MKWDWGKGIALSFTLFCGFVVWIVVQAFYQDFDLVSETYYQDELVYQERIDQKTNLHKSGSRIQVSQTKDVLILNYPSVFEQAEGEVRFYHPSRAIFDRAFAMEMNEDRLQEISKDSIVKGRYKLQLIWKAQEKEYYQEEELFIK